MPADGAWWRCFDDQVLDSLIIRATEANATLDQAQARLARARAAVRAGEAARGPQASLYAGAIGPSDTSRHEDVSNTGWAGAGLRVSYDPDLFDRSGPARQAALDDAGVAEAWWQATRLAVQADVAHAYLALRALEAERALLREAADDRDEALQIAQRQFQRGLISEVPLAALVRDAATARADQATLERRHQELTHALAVLLGESPTDWALPPAVHPWPGALPQVPAGIPSEVLARRPDLAATAHAVRAATARVGAAHAAGLPSIQLTASGGLAASGLVDLLHRATRVAGLGLLLDLPVFDAGRREAATQAALADLDGTLAAHRERVWVSLREVEDQLSALEASDRQRQALAPALQAAVRSREVASSRERRGLAARPEVLASHQLEIQQRRALLQAELARLQGTVVLIRALGGGWGSASG